MFNYLPSHVQLFTVTCSTIYRRMFDYLPLHVRLFTSHVQLFTVTCSTIYRHRFDHPQPACSRPCTCRRASLVSVNTAASTHRCDPCMRSFLSQINQPYVPTGKLRKFELEKPTNIIPTAMTRILLLRL